MRTYKFIARTLSCVIIGYSLMNGQAGQTKKETFQPLSYEVADQMADSVLNLMTREEKIAYIGGDRSFFISFLSRACILRKCI